MAVASVLGINSSNPTGAQVRADRDGAFLVGGFDQPVQALGGVVPDREQPDVVNYAE